MDFLWGYDMKIDNKNLVVVMIFPRWRMSKFLAGGRYSPILPVGKTLNHGGGSLVSFSLENFLVSYKNQNLIYGRQTSNNRFFPTG